MSFCHKIAPHNLSRPMLGQVLDKNLKGKLRLYVFTKFI